MNLITAVFGSKHERDIKKIRPLVEQINEIYPTLKDLSDTQLADKTGEFKKRLEEGETLDGLLPEAFAVVKEACRRLCGKSWPVVAMPIGWEMVPFDVQLIGGIVLHQGKIAEMATGEGKTLVATLPLYLNALEGKGAHLVTVNDYLARRDAEWMGPVFQSLGLTVGCIQNEMDPPARREQYSCDITYGTNNEFGFDYLRDNMSVRLEDRVQRGFAYAIVDEVDSVLIDEARTPLIISGPVSHSTNRYNEMKPLVEQVVKKQTVLTNKLIAEAEDLLKTDDGEKEYEAGIKLLAVQRGAPKNKKFLKLGKEPGIKKLIHRVETDYLRDKKLFEIDDLLYYSIDERENSCELGEMGRSQLSPEDQRLFVIPDITEGLSEIEGDENLSDREKQLRKEKLYTLHAERSEKVHNISQLLKSYSLFEKDVEYVVQDGKILIVDEFTGRLMPGRRYSDGLHQAIEAKEGVKVEGETQTLATVTLQNFFRLYDKLAGMTGTAVTEAGEFYEIYKLDVTSIPTNKPVRRIDYNDQVFRTKREKYNAIINEVTEYHQKGRPVLVGTTSVDVSETLSRMLKRQGIVHSVLNAKYHQQEAEIVTRAGQGGAATIATNMAGRGTDIKLGPGVVKHPHCALVDLDPEVESCPYIDELDCYAKVPCGLHIIGTERHEARRIDRQLRGRSGRQGDPGSSRFYLSLEDDLMRLFGSDRIAAVMDRLGLEEGEVIEHRMVTRAIERAQKRVEMQNFAIRKHLLDYDNVMNKQREVIYARRLEVLEKEDLSEDVVGLIEEVAENIVFAHCKKEELPENWNWTALKDDLRRTFLLDLKISQQDIEKLDYDTLVQKVKEMALQVYRAKEAAITPEVMRQLEKFALLSTIDERWREHLYEMDQLRTGIGLRAYGQRDPLIEYKKEAYGIFEQMVGQIDREAIELIYRLQVGQPREVRRPRPEAVRAVHAETTGMGLMGEGAEPEPAEEKQKPVRVEPKVGRNDPCPCGSGKKYKKCHGAVAA